ncbi:methyl-accepting chemotaxis protein [Roseibium denhamense]|uniref:Methyl-accepting chemotaxis protein n=1 Tax=Roseibium denhamense TaxID=76305 RepID=A0ABY1P9L4_9HYPH|nr:HAMP domain-containing methyl-accepting chemotaxis protein [Roseibium denhamense]MTI07398.1 methyl-accepting chemotaxis protein [Roseibium denhamense]SMP29368.1 methyl-accepting chemotaxis protein [Roseibium denhamense]
MKFISDLRISARVGGLSAIAVIAITVLLGTSYYTQRIVSSEIENLAEYSQMDFKVSQVQAHAQNMQTAQKEFLLTSDAGTIETYNTEYNEALSNLEDVAAKPQSAPVSAEIEALRGILGSHKAQFDVLTSHQVAMGVDENSGLKGQLRSAVHEVEEKLKAANLDALTVKMLMMRRHEKDFMLRGDDKYIGRIDDRRAEFADLLATTDMPEADKMEISALLDTYQSSFGEFAQKSKEIVATRDAINETYTQIAPAWSALSEAAYLGKQAASAALATAEKSSQRMSLTVSGISLVLAIGIGWLIGRSITRPINDLTATMRDLSGGNTDVDVHYTDRKNEIGSIARAVEVFRSNLLRTAELEAEQKDLAARSEAEKRAMMDNLANQFDSTVGAIVQRVSAAAASLDQNAMTLSRVSQSTSERAENAASASSQTTHNVEVVAAATEEMTASISEINQQVIRASESSKNAAKDVAQTADQMDSLASMADRIGEVISMISDIAEQTNLLALNATIESARAGEAGKGFAVVASEVKALANETAKATESISQLVTEIQSETKTAVGSIGKIGEVIRDLEQSSSAIAAAMEEQGATTQSVAENVAQAASGTRDVSDTIQIVKDGSVESSGATREVQGSINDLSQQSELLREEVARFLDQIRAA